MTFQYRMYPTRKQINSLKQTLDGCRWLYNHLLEQRKTLWETEKKSISCFDQCNTFKSLKVTNPFLNNIHSQVLQNVATRIDLAFKAFFRRIKAGDNPGYPRFRGKNRYDSFTFPQSGYKVFDKYINLSKIGNVKVNFHRPTEGTIKTCTIRRKPTDKWFISFACDIDFKPVEKPVNPAVGIDLGIENFATLSNGEKIKNPRFFKASEKILAKAQRKLSAQEKGSKKRMKARKVVAHVHEKINNQRHNFAHQESRKLVNRFNSICIENLSINNMKKDNFRSMNKSIGDAAWRMFLECLKYKAEYAGSHCIQVNPAYTSQICSRCGHRHKLELSDRVYRCPSCGLVMNRDHNASLNILRLGMQSLPLFSG
ncbi:MAG: transposase [Candidatus Neomarinimicrobiota bacterium]